MLKFRHRPRRLRAARAPGPGPHRSGNIQRSPQPPRRSSGPKSAAAIVYIRRTSQSLLLKLKKPFIDSLRRVFFLPPAPVNFTGYSVRHWYYMPEAYCKINPVSFLIDSVFSCFGRPPGLCGFLALSCRMSVSGVLFSTP